ncbi:hypothetical protein MTO96_051423, partial [Rhipicephalus appendiculatus]
YERDKQKVMLLSCAVPLWILFLHMANAISIDKSDGGYTDVRVSIHKAVPYNETIVKNIKTLMQQSSEFLHQATHGSLHIKEVIIEIPSMWPPRPNATVRQGSGFERSDIRVSASSDPRADHRPSTLQPRPCGQPGDYIDLPSRFLEELDGHTTMEYGNPSYVFVHEWAHLRYGVFDEYGMPGSDKYPELYCDSDGNVSEFCVGNSGDNNRHNVLAPNKQNDLCRGKSAWEVISSNDDFMGFKNAFNKFMDSDPATTEQLTVDLLDSRIRNRWSSTPFFIVNFFAALSKSPAPFVDVHSSP